jgi:malonyl-CoA O-methyltransferase
MIGSLYCPGIMADLPESPRPRATRVDPIALRHHLHRTAFTTTAPWLHEEIARRMGERLDLIRRQPESIIDWWSPLSGSGARLRAQYPHARVVSIGLDHQPLPASADTRWWQRLLGTRPASAPAMVPTAQLLWANMMLHWIDDLPTLLARWHAALEVDGFLMFSCFGPDTLRELRAVHASLDWGAPGSDWIDMHDLGDELVHAGFADPVMDMERLTLTWDSPAALLAELRSLGGNTAPARQPGLRGRQWRRRLEMALTERLAGPDGRLALSFEIIYGHAFRPMTRAPVQARTEISLDAMREMTRRRNPGAAD